MDKTFKYEHSFVALVAVTKLINDHKSNQIYPLIGDIWKPYNEINYKNIQWILSGLIGITV